MEGLLQSAEKVPHHPNFWFYTHPSILADGFSAVALILAVMPYLVFSCWHEFSVLESISAVLHRYLVVLVNRFLLNLIPGLIAWEFTDI